MSIKRPRIKPERLAYYTKYLDYIKNAGGAPTVEWFDEDWSPIGPMIRTELAFAGLARVIEGRIYLT